MRWLGRAGRYQAWWGGWSSSHAHTSCAVWNSATHAQPRSRCAFCVSCELFCVHLPAVVRCLCWCGVRGQRAGWPCVRACTAQRWQQPGQRRPLLSVPPGGQSRQAGSAGRRGVGAAAARGQRRQHGSAASGQARRGRCVTVSVHEPSSTGMSEHMTHGLIAMSYNEEGQPALEPHRRLWRARTRRRVWQRDGRRRPGHADWAGRVQCWARWCWVRDDEIVFSAEPD